MPYKLGRVSREGLKRVHWSPRKSTAAVPPNIANRCSLKPCVNESRRLMQQFFPPTCVARRAAYGGCNYRVYAQRQDAQVHVYVYLYAQAQAHLQASGLQRLARRPLALEHRLRPFHWHITLGHARTSALVATQVAKQDKLRGES